MEVQEFSYDVVSKAVDFIYGIDIPEEFDDAEDLESLLHVGDLYLMENLKDAVGARIAMDLNEDNALDYAQLAEKFKATKLSAKCAEFILGNPEAFDEGNLNDLGGGIIDASFAKRAVQEAKNNIWMRKLFGDKEDFKKRADFESVEDYRGYVMSKIKAKMFVRCNRWSAWRHSNAQEYGIQEGNIGFVLNTDSFASATVMWLTLSKGDAAGPLCEQPSKGAYENLDLLTSPVNFNC